MATFSTSPVIATESQMEMEMEDRPGSKESFTTDGLTSIIGTARTDHCPASLTPVCGESASEDEVADELRFHEILNMAAEPHYSSPHSPSPKNPSLNDPYSVAISFTRDDPSGADRSFPDEEVKLEIAGTQLNRDFMHLDSYPAENLMSDFFHHQNPPPERPGSKLEEVLASNEEDAQPAPSPATLQRRHTFEGQNDAALPPFLGGYVDKRTGKKYLHAAQQTDEILKEVQQKPEMLTRQTQIYLVKNECTTTTREASVQMVRPGILLDNTREYTRTPGKYVDSEEWQKHREAASTIIQRYTRKWIANRKANRLRAYLRASKEFFIEQDKKYKDETEVNLMHEMERRRNPHTIKDFDVLYKELKTWYLEEIKLLQAIDKMKMTAMKENLERETRKKMVRMSAAKIWELSDGKVVHVRTPSTLRAADLMHLHTALGKAVTSREERMCILGYVRWTVEDYEYPLTKEIVQLIDRETDLLYRKRPSKSLAGLRERILSLFLEFIETPEFNPEAAAYQAVPPDFDFGPRQTLTRRDAPLLV